MTRALLAAMIAAALFLTTAWAAKAEDGYDLWLRYPAVEAGAATDYRAAATQLVVAGDSPTLGVAVDELERGLSGLLGAAPERAGAVSRDGAVLVGRAGDAAIAALGLDLSELGAEGYVIRSVGRGRACGDGDRGRRRRGRAVWRVPLPAADPDAAGADGSGHPRGAGGEPAPAEPLGQSGPDGGAGIRGPVAVGLAQAAGPSGPALYRLRPRQRLHRDQRDGHQQRQHRCR